MKKIQTILCAAALASMSLFASCEKEKTQSNLPKNSILVAVQDYSSDSKAYISGTYTNWENGDKVVLGIHNSEGDNSYEATIGITSPNGVPITAATVNGGEFKPAKDDEVYGAYPVSLFKDNNGDLKTLGTNVIINLPSEYSYTATGEHQLLTSPMVAYTVKNHTDADNENDVLYFTNVCAMLKITLNAPESGSFTLDAIEISADNTQLSGAASVNCKNASMSWTSSNTSYNKVTLNFGANAVAINATKSFYVPIPPVSSGTVLHISLHNQIDDSWMTQIDNTHPLTVTLNQALPAHTIANVKDIQVTGNETYRFYKYIEGKGTAYIDLNVHPTNTSIMEMTFRATRPTGSQFYSGSAPASGTLWFAISGSTHDRFLLTDFMNEQVKSNNAGDNTIYRDSGKKYQVRCEALSHVVSGDTKYYMRSIFRELHTGDDAVIDKECIKTSGDYTDRIPNDVPTIKVFASRSGNTYCPGMKLYSYKVWIDGTSADPDYNFAPAKRTSDGKIGLYNQADGTFIEVESTHFRLGDDETSNPTSW